MAQLLTARFWWRQRSNQLLNWLFPNDITLCVMCDRPVGHVPSPDLALRQQADERAAPTGAGVCLCPFCLQDLALCEAAPTTQQLCLPFTVDRLDVCSALTYDHFIRTMIRAWKYDGVMELTGWFAAQVAIAWTTFTPAIRREMLLVPVPSTPDRTRKRGYDHVGLLTQHLSRELGLRVMPALRRQRIEAGFTQSQTAKTAAQRQHGIAKAYVHNKLVSVRGAHVLLVDDIVTTGATLATCAEQLYKAGAAAVQCAVIARVI